MVSIERETLNCGHCGKSWKSKKSTKRPRCAKCKKDVEPKTDGHLYPWRTMNVGDVLPWPICVMAGGAIDYYANDKKANALRMYEYRTKRRFRVGYPPGVIGGVKMVIERLPDIVELPRNE